MRAPSFLRDNAPFLLSGALLTLMSSFGQTYFISIFSGRIIETYGLTDARWGAIYAIGTTVSAVVMIWSGALADRFRVRTLAVAVLILLAFACVLMGAVHSVWMLPVIIFLLRFAGQGMTSHLAVVAMTRWFVAARGRALAIASLGFSLGEALLPLAFVALMVFVDWRLLWFASAIAILLVLPLLLRLLRQERTPKAIAVETEAVGLGGRFWTRGQMLRNPLFWLVVPAIVGPSAWNTAFFFQQVRLAEAKGWAHIELVALFPIYTLSAVITVFIAGFAVDRFGAIRLMAFVQVPFAVAFFGLALAASIPGMLIWMIVLGFAQGCQAAIPNAFWAEVYGTRYIGAIKAVAAAAMVFGSAVGPAITGALLTANMGIESQFQWVAGYFVLTFGLAALGISRARAQAAASPE